MKSILRYELLILAVTYFFLTPLLMAGENTAEILAFNAIYAPDNSVVHFLAKPDLGLPDSSITIDRAFLEFSVAPQSTDSTFISLRIYPIMIDWDQNNVSWTSPWIVPGGDFNDVEYAEFLVTVPGVQNVQIDITDLCMRWADGRLPYFGFIVAGSESSLHRFDIVRNGESDPFAKVKIEYIRIP